MADWYVSSVAYAAIAQFTISHAYSVGDLIRGLAAPAYGSEQVFRCTTAGTSAGTEPTWNQANNGTTASGTATFTCVSGQSTYGWSAAAGSLGAVAGGGSSLSRIAVGDRVYVSSDSTETRAAAYLISNTATLTSPAAFFSVDRAGSVPPVAADITSGAQIGTSGGFNIQLEGPIRWDGFVFNCNGTFLMNNNTKLPTVFKNCKISLNNASSTSARIKLTGSAKLTLDNTPVSFANASQGIDSPSVGGTLEWLNTPSAVQGTVPTTLFPFTTGMLNATCRGLDLSAVNTALVDVSPTVQSRYLFANCKLNASVSATTGTPSTDGVVIEMVNCDSGNTNYRCEKHTAAGDLTTETTITLSGGASDGTTTFSRKLVSSLRANNRVLPLEGFTIDQWNAATGTSKTATVEIISSGTLTSADIALRIEYLGDASFPTSTVTDNAANVISTGSNHPTSSATWNASPATPVRQQLQVTFTPQKAGLVRGTVVLTKPSTTAYYNPVLAIA